MANDIRRVQRSRPRRLARARERSAGAAALLASVLVTGCAQTPPAPTAPSVTPVTSAARPTSPTPAATSATTAAPAVPTTLQCAARVVKAMSPAERAGQVVMVGVTNGSPDEVRVLERYGIGTVILMGRHADGIAGVKRITARLKWNDQRTPVLVATDQEGGAVQRLTGQGFSAMPSAQTQATWTDARLRARAKTWGAQLRKAGVRWTMAPVADVVPPGLGSRNAPIGALRRGYGTKPSVVADKVAAFSAGMQAAGVATSVKHFPGIGRVSGNTDFSAEVTDRITVADDPFLRPFKAGVQGSRSSVMVSTVTYAKIDPKQPAAFSSTVLKLVRSTLGFDGVVISDDLGAAAAAQRVPARDRAVRFVAAGGDVAMTVAPGLADDFVEGLRRAQNKDKSLASRVIAAATRVVALKIELGLVPCR